MSRKLLMNNTVSFAEEGLLLYYLFTDNLNGDSTIKDLSGNNNDTYVYGGYEWSTDGLIFNNTSYNGTRLNTPVTPTIDNRDFKLEFYIKSISKGTSVFSTICTTQPQDQYDTGLNCTGTFGDSYSRLTFELSGCIFRYDINSTAYNLKVVINKEGNNVTVAINDQSLGTQQIGQYSISSEFLTFGLANMTLQYIKYYEY